MASTHEFVLFLTISARTSSAAAVMSIPSGSGWNIAAVLSTIGKKE
jgi:hypothetical protein